MFFTFLLQLTAKDRNRRTNRQLGGILAFVAGAINAGGFLAVRRYTSHMTGIVSSMADDLVGGSVGLALAGLVSLAAFIGGAISTTLLISWHAATRCAANMRWHCCWRPCCCLAWWAPT